MLTQDEEKFLQSIPKGKKVKIIPFDKKATEIAQGIISKVKKVLPELEVKHMGASGLEISGQPDLDIYALANPNDFEKYLPSLIKIFGQPKSSKTDSVAWEFDREGYNIEFYLTDPSSSSMKRQLAVFEILRKNDKLRREYEKLKASMDGRSYQDYQKKKYEFYRRILRDTPNT